MEVLYLNSVSYLTLNMVDAFFRLEIFYARDDFLAKTKVIHAF